MLTWHWSIFSALLVADALRVRGRVSAIPLLAPSEEPVSGDHRFLVAHGVTLDDATRRAASAHARAAKLGVLDLVPQDTRALPAWGLLQFLDPAQYRKDVLGRGISAGHAVLVTTDVLARAQVAETDIVDEVALVRIAGRLKWYASASTDVAIAPGLPARPSKKPLAVLRARTGGGVEFVLIGIPIILGIVAFAAATGEWHGLGLLAAFQLQPLIAFAGSRLRAPGLVVTLLFRWLLDLWSWLTLLFEKAPATAVNEVDARRPEYARLLAAGTAPFFEPRRDDCPLCGSRDLRRALRTGDLLQGKPGQFTVDRCRSCRHLFQNPRLSIEGLEFYYKDFYDGLGGDELEAIFGASLPQYHQRAAFVQAATTPSKWLDVGGGHGHLCRILKERMPGARFDALDLSESIEDAERRGWVDRGYRGLFPDMAPDLAGHYDVVSMSHYLEHTREPRAEIAAAAIALVDGGHLMIELPDPECPLRHLGRLWLPWFQPQHQHLLSIGNLEELLSEHGLTTVARHRGPAHQRIDFFAAVILILHWVAPKPDVPWRPPSAARRLLRKVCFLLAIPWLLVARIADPIFGFFLERLGGSNTYRVLARKDAKSR